MKAPTKAGAASMARKLHVQKLEERKRVANGNDPDKDKKDGEYDDELQQQLQQSSDSDMDETESEEELVVAKTKMMALRKRALMAKTKLHGLGCQSCS